MRKAYIVPSQCDKLPFCSAKRICPVGAISKEKKGLFLLEPPIVDEEKCIGCGKCIEVCLKRAIVLK